MAESSSSGRTETEQSFDIKSKADLINKEDRNSPNYYELPYYPLKYLERLLKSISKLRFGIKIGLVIGGIALLFLIDLILLIYIFNTDKSLESVEQLHQILAKPIFLKTSIKRSLTTIRLFA